jgi:hypothetical protein
MTMGFGCGAAGGGGRVGDGEAVLASGITANVTGESVGDGAIGVIVGVGGTSVGFGVGVGGPITYGPRSRGVVHRPL